MTNTLTPFGFAVSRSKNATLAGNVTACYVPATNNAKLYIGDAVSFSGGNAAAIEEYKVGNLPAIAKASANSAIDGVIVGFLPDGAFTGSTYMPASKAGVALVITNKEITFNIQATGSVSASDIGKYAKISVATDGDDYTGISGMALDHSTLSTNASLPLKVLNVADYVTNDAGNYAIVEVELNIAVAAASGN